MRSHTLAACAASLLLVAAACSDSSGPKIGPPASVVVTSAPTTTGAVKGSLGTFAVKVSDASGQAVSGAVVNFSANGGGGIVLTPTSMATDATGIARTTVVLGTQAGSATLSASVTGVTAAATVAVTTTPGAVAKLVATPEDIRLTAVGETAQLSLLLQDAYANAVTGSTISYTVGDPTLVSVDSAGLVRALRVGGSTSVVASVSGQADTVSVSVLAPGASACTGVGTPTTLAVGAMTDVSGAAICLGGAAAMDYTVVAYNTSADGSTPLTASIVANGVANPPSAFRAPSGLSALAARSPIGATSAADPVLDESFHLKLLASTRAMSRLFAPARAARTARQSARSAATSGQFSPSAAYSAIPATVAVGDIVKLNTNGDNACDIAKTSTFRVAAVGSKSIVLADTLNPANGFVDADYARFAARFDTLVYPLDVSNFGAPSDLDNNQKVAILFTRAVNELTPPNSGSFVGGFFFGRDLFPKVDEKGVSLCKTSNEGEMFYMLVPDPAGAVNGNKFRLGFVDTLTTGILAHEFQHLINLGRRLYVNNAGVDEDTWLNEGLSHAAEELLYYRESGMQPRQRLTDAAIRVNSRATYPFWKADASSNFGRFIDYLQDPGNASPLDEANDELATRGASWSFLRYSVDRLYTSDAGVWARFVNSTTAGLATVRLALGTDPTPLLSDYALANYLSDLGITTNPRFVHQSWNFRDIYANTYISLGGYPLLMTGLANGVATPVSVKGSSASYFRLSVAAAGEALVKVSSGQGAPNTSFRFTVIRTK
ncbi:MAG: Peptidase hyicolysin [Gemmatimonadetes bacterium]|nr:Peptidase hyicolysin [Gemmatimonadota bacterium]